LFYIVLVSWHNQIIEYLQHTCYWILSRCGLEVLSVQTKITLI